MSWARAAALAGALGLAGCGAAGSPALPPDVVPTPVGVGPGYRLAPGAHGRCVPGGPRFGVHLELFARRRVLIVPAGIGQRAPLRRRGRRTAGRCSLALRTAEPTGVVEVRRGTARPTLGRFFAVWGQPLGARRLGPFHGAVAAYVGGHRWRGAVRAVPLTPHAEVVLEVGGFVPPHPSYLFPPGL